MQHSEDLFFQAYRTLQEWMNQLGFFWIIWKSTLHLGGNLSLDIEIIQYYKPILEFSGNQTAYAGMKRIEF